MSLSSDGTTDRQHHVHLLAAAFQTPIGSFCAQVLLTEVLVLVIQRVSNGQDQFFEEFLCTFQTAVLNQELNIINKAYGIWMYAFGMFSLGILYTLTFRKGVHANPVSTIHLYSTYDRMTEIAELVVHISVQTFAAVVAQKYVFLLWSTRIFNSGLAVVYMEDPCMSELQVPVVVGILVEGASTFVLRMIHHAPRGGMEEVILCSLAGVVCNLVATPFTGGYSNPSLALTSQFACHGHEHWEFFIVYVGGPVIAAYLVGQHGDQLWHILQSNRHRALPVQEHHHHGTTVTL